MGHRIRMDQGSNCPKRRSQTRTRASSAANSKRSGNNRENHLQQKRTNRQEDRRRFRPFLYRRSPAPFRRRPNHKEPTLDDTRPDDNIPESDEDEYDNRMLGFIETKSTITKTNSAKQKRRRPIPMVAHSWGIYRKNWGRIWVQMRKEQGLNA